MFETPIFTVPKFPELPVLEGNKIASGIPSESDEIVLVAES